MRLVLFLAVLGHTIFCQAQSLKGKIRLNEHWKQMVYLIEVSNFQMLFGGSADNVIDSSYASPEGHFHFNGLKKSTLYRLNVVPTYADVAGMLIQDGSEDNYAFFATGMGGDEVIYFTADIAQLYRSYRLVCVERGLNELLKEILAVREAKLPNYDSMVILGSQMNAIPQSDSAALVRFQQDAIRKLQEVNTVTSNTLLERMKTFKNPQSVALGLIYCDFEQQRSDPRVSEMIAKLRPYAKDRLVSSIFKASMRTMHKMDSGFFSRDYLALDGRKVRLDHIDAAFILLDFWASWCLPCRKAILTSIKNLLLEFDSRDLQVIGINAEEDKAKAIQAVKNDNNTSTQIWEGDSRYLHNLFGVESIPFYLLINTETKEIMAVKSAELIYGELKERLKHK